MRDNLNSFRDGIVAEIDFAQEAENIATFAKAYPDNPGFTGIEALAVSDNKTVLIMNPAKGVDFKKLETLPPEQRSQAAEKYAHAIYEQIFGEKHYFHADPHPGNVKFDPESGKVVFLDLGATATISTDDMRELYRALGFLVARDSKGLANFYVDNAANISSTLSKTELRAALRQDIQAMFDKPGFTASFLIESVKDINDIATRHGVWPKSGNTWLTKTLFTANNVFYKTDVSGGNLSSIGMPYIVKGMAAAYKQNPKAWQGTFLQVAGTLGKSPVTVAKSILELSRVNPAVLDGVPQGMLTAIRAIAISGGISGETAPGAAQK
jgi:predicted unusual protein kinase regulating ubiquinone biosynthesis (AarF/ABC1/UbiB family)